MKESKRSSDTPPRETLIAVLDASDSPLRRGSMNVPQTRTTRAAFAEASSNVFGNILEQLKEQTSAFNFDIECLSVAKLADTARDRVSAIDEFSGTFGATHERASFYRGLAAGHPSSASRKLDDVALSTVIEAIRPLEHQFIDVAANFPFQGREIAKRCLDALELLAFPKVAHTAARRLQNVAGAERTLRDQQAMLASHIRERLLPEFVEHSKQLSNEALHAVCQERVTNALRSEVSKLRTTISRSDDSCKTFRRKASAVKDLFAQDQRRRHQEDAVTSSATIIPLKGPTASDLVAAMASRETVSGSGELAGIHLDSLVDTLSQIAKAQFPHVDCNAGIGELVARLPEDATHDAVMKIVAQSIGGLPTVYASIRPLGASKIVQSLFKRAAVLVSLGGYEHEAFHIQPIHQTLVRFPPRLGMDDEQVFLDLKAAFSAIDPGCLFADAGEEESDILCVRTLVGFPICVEETNVCLLEATATCAPHAMFLFGLHSDDGQPSEAIKRLYALLNPQTEIK